ncbi:Foldase protein PrsA 3 precursor [Thalassovita gelatinovora]|uniref:Parvulin-like PPIase n=1 Tax=Thalassovita gelatinovora TaxID=53501 RepID=A0A0P1F936_THAGE|nr:peptidylprolyl isomerase [Thalassovita gelatinovora]QIZ81307.1 peptidase [Thalassovita gelatinovora]CUH64534.1 Foldase protein PrsA 3 precursor [Thalassovita gelatinovora]SEP96753.1 peptidyl-prolyl cis-trans isomerase C [Thalassovita gelatinovora]
MHAALFPDLIVNGETVPSTAIAAEAQNHTAPKGKPGLAWRKAANAMAVRILLLQEARHRGLTPDPVEIGPGRFETEEEALIRELLDIVVVVDRPSKTAVRAEWSRDPSRFRTPPLWEVSHILITCDPTNAENKAVAFTRAQDLVAQALANPKGFAQLAERYSDCGSKASGGALGQLSPGDSVPEFEAALGTLAEGEITAQPVLTRHGWHLIRLDAVAQGAVLPFDAVAGKIAEAMEKADWACKARAFVDQLVASAEISGAELQAIDERRPS